MTNDTTTPGAGEAQDLTVSQGSGQHQCGSRDEQTAPAPAPLASGSGGTAAEYASVAMANGQEVCRLLVVQAKLGNALAAITDACLDADAREELAEEIDGSLLDEAEAALALIDRFKPVRRSAPHLSAATPGAVDELTDVFERPFTDPDDPRLQCARMLTKSEAEAVLEFRGDLGATLASPAVTAAALTLAVDHLEHMAAWLGKLGSGYSFEALGEDMPAIKAGLTPRASASVTTASLPAAIAEIDVRFPGAFWLLGYGVTKSGEPPYGVRILFGSDEVLAEGEGETPTAAILAALGTAQ